MKELIILEEYRYIILTFWFLTSIWGLYVSTLRAFVDRVRAGIATMPDNQESDKLLESLLAAPNHERPYHVESAFLSTLQIILGTTSFTLLLKTISTSENYNFFGFWTFFFFAFVWESAWIGIASQSFAASSFLNMHLKLGKPLMLCFANCLSTNLTIILLQIEKFVHSWTIHKSRLKMRKTN